MAGQPGAEPLQGADRRVLVTGLDPAEDVSLFTDEVFADVLGVVRLPAATVEEYLAAATEFANERLTGSLAATMLVHPSTIKAHRTLWIGRSRISGTAPSGSTSTAVMAAGLGYTTWGGYPGATPQEHRQRDRGGEQRFPVAEPAEDGFHGAFHPLVKPRRRRAIGQTDPRP